MSGVQVANPNPGPSIAHDFGCTRDPCVCELSADYRRGRGWNPDPGPTSRISVALPRDLVRRLNDQARASGVPRHQIIEAAVEGLVSEWEQIDNEEAQP